MSQPDRESPLEVGKHLEEDDYIYRRVPNETPDMMVSDLVSGRVRPSSGAFKPDEDGVSVYSAMALSGLSLATSVLLNNPANVLAKLSVSGVVQIGLTVVGDPWPTGIPDPDNPRNAAHALVQGFEGLSARDRKTFQRALAGSPSLVIERPEAE